MDFTTTAFIDHSPEARLKLQKHLDHAVLHRDIAPIIGIEGCGKTWMLYDWMAHSSYASHVLYLRLPKTKHLKSLGASPEVALLKTFSKLDHSLKTRIHSAYADAAFTTAPIKTWTKQQFYEGYNRIVDCLQLQHIWCIVLDQAHELRTETWEEILELRADCRHMVGIVVCLSHTTSTSARDLWESLERSIHRRDHAQSLHTLIPMTRANFETTILKQWAQLYTIDDNAYPILAEVFSVLWQKTQGDWHAVNGVHKTLEHMVTNKRINKQCLQQLMERYTLQARAS